MAKLANKRARRIAELIDSLSVADTVYSTAVLEDNPLTARHWLQESDYCKVRLYTEFGIAVAGIESALVRWDGYRNA